MGRAIVRDPQVFLFDEPLSNLDAKLRVQMRLEIRKLQQRLGVTSIYVTHDQVEAMTLGDRLMVLNGGYVEQFGTPIELYDRPASVFVAGFIGSPAMNFIPATVAADGMGLPNGAKLAAPQLSEAQAQAGSVLLGIRPEHLVADEDGPIAIDVDMVEQLGANTLLHGMLSGTTHAMVASVSGHVSTQAGAQHRFSAAPELLHLFDAKTEKRLEA
jgi:sn-glycerol 3-phosphate transport system ATP-binding protein